MQILVLTAIDKSRFRATELKSIIQSVFKDYLSIPLLYPRPTRPNSFPNSLIIFF